MTKDRKFIPKGNARYDRHDAYYRRAKQEGYAARSIYKLEEIDKKFKLLRRGDHVLDLGCAPGSWLQYAVGAVGEKGRVVGIDLLPVRLTLAPNVTILQGDAFETPPEAYGGAFDVVLSDMAPDTTGVRSLDQARSEALFERALEIAESTLAPGGNFVGKLFQGPDFQKLLQRVRGGFAEARTVKPAGSRKESIEQYVVGLGRKT
jgi:23S rRNA (uridine2552-2'-O)-methyltransferase